MMAKPRFIAGAVCPECQASDRLVIEAVENGQQRRCVSCGFQDQQINQSVAGVPRGKPEKPVARDTQTQTISIFDPNKPS